MVLTVVKAESESIYANLKKNGMIFRDLNKTYNMSNVKDQIKKDAHKAEKKMGNASHEIADKTKGAAEKVKGKAEDWGHNLKKKN
ncbi:MAG TPA: hypothetical protein VMU83_00945 [Hanamia sp.]|nr:hypothetical protein [Hanamia sp.]